MIYNYLIVDGLEGIAATEDGTWLRLRVITLIGCTISAVALSLSLVFFVWQIMHTKVTCNL